MKTRATSLVASIVIFAGVLGLIQMGDLVLHHLRVPNDSVFARNYYLAAMTTAWLAGAFLFSRLVDYFVWNLLLARTLNSTVPGALKALGGIVIFLITVTCIVGLVFQRSVTGFLAALGAGSFALGFALKNLFSDIFVGLAVNLDGTFRIGDWIELSDRNGITVGQIEEIGWRSTHLLTDDAKTVVIPNSYLGINRITNVSRPCLATRFSTIITLDFSVPVDRAKRVLLASLHAIHDTPGFFTERGPEVLVAEANERGLEYILRYWIEPWIGISPKAARDVVMNSAMEHMRTAGILPAYEKADVFHRDMPVRNWEGHSRPDQLALLSRLDLFRMLEPDELEKLADAMERRTYRGGGVLFQQGDPGDSLFILTEGLLDVFVNTDGNGSDHRVARILPGQFVGEMSILTGDARSATISAATPSIVYEIKGDAVHELLEHRPQIALQLSEVMAERKMSNAAVQRQLNAPSHDDEAASFARQFLTRMRNFISHRQKA